MCLCLTYIHSLLGENLAGHNLLLSVFKTGLGKQANGLWEASLVS